MTSERELLLKAVCNMKSHFHQDNLQNSLSNEGHDVAATTIYRNLPLLVEAGIIRRTCYSGVEGKPDAATYEHIWGHEHHDHLICTICGKKVEFSYHAIEVLQEAVAREHGFTLESHHLELIGTCQECGGRPSAEKE
jgi:Fur family transcriptional regulator, ferric uptake regulator